MNAGVSCESAYYRRYRLPASGGTAGVGANAAAAGGLAGG